MLMPYEEFIQLLEKWKAFLDTDDDPKELVITMDDDYNFTLEHVLNGEEKII